jgi:Asp-tRNA(Asn)/Glu-tRNA(Gln) amidotransferase C subunit
MSYLQAISAQEIAPETIELLARLVELNVPSEDVQSLAETLRDQLASMELIDRLDLTDVSPILEFDPRWHD